MLDANARSLPLPLGYQPVANTEPVNPVLRQRYQTLIGSLIYLMIGTRPDISFAVTKMAQYAANCKGTAPFPTTDLVSDPVSDTSDSRKPALRPRRPNTFPAVCLSRCLPIREMFVPYLVVYRPPASESGSLSLFSSDPPLWQVSISVHSKPAIY